MAGERVLVVDDTAENVTFVVDYVLKPNGYTALVARDGAEGLRKALTERPDLILLDVQMPKMTGIEVLEALQQEGQEIPVILMTFHGSEELVVNVFRKGVKDYVIKPFQVTELLDAISGALSEARLRAERDDLLERLVTANGQLERWIKESNILSSVGKSVASMLDLEKLLSRLVDAAVYLTGAEEGWIMMLDGATDELYVRAAKGIDEVQARSLRLRVDDSLAGAVIRSGEPIVIGDGRYKVKTSYLVKALIAVPLKVGQRTIGVLSVDYRVADRSFSSNALGLLSALADYAAIAIENARLFAEVGAERSRLEDVLSGTSEAILVVDDEGRLLLWNEAAVHILALGAAVREGQSAIAVVPSPELRDLLARAAHGETELSIEVPLDDGRTFNANLTPIHRHGIGSVIVMQDITHLKELDRLKSEFVSTVSHDLRSPLTSIRGFVDLIEMMGPLSDQQRTFVAKIRKGVSDITTLIEDLLDLGRIEAGAGFEFRTVDVAEVISASVDNLRGEAESKQQRLDVVLPPGLPAVSGNAVRLGQVVSNLVGNAIKYTPASGHIEIRAEAQDHQLLVHVKDDGLGISADDQMNLFQKFYRVKTVDTQDIPGTGLGLAITESIVNRHGGRIWVDSEIGKGSAFTFLLPVSEPDDASGAAIPLSAH